MKKCVKMQTMYIFYLMRHKFWVMYFCFKHGLFWQGIVHDWDKLLPSMLYTYARHYPMIRRKRNTDGCYNPLEAPPDYQRAMLEHFNRSKHHWQHWIMANGVVYQLLGRQAAKQPELPLRVLGPTPGNIEKINENYRYKLTVKCRNDRRFRDLMRETLGLYEQEKLPAKATVVVDLHSDGDI